MLQFTNQIACESRESYFLEDAKTRIGETTFEFMDNYFLFMDAGNGRHSEPTGFKVFAFGCGILNIVWFSLLVSLLKIWNFLYF